METSIKDLDQLLQDKFPISSSDEYEAPLNNGPYRIGVNLNYPAELRMMLTAASMTYLLQNKSIDHTRKKILSSLSYDEDPGGQFREDRRIRKNCSTRISAIVHGIVSWNEKHENERPDGEVVCDMTVVRIPYSIERSFAEADKGALYESVAITRMALEQLCWAIKVRGLENPDEIRRTKVTKSITALSKINPRVGSLYGWLSNHAHWSYDAQVKAVIFDPPGMLHASYKFKACAYASLILFSRLFDEIIYGSLQEFIDPEAVERAMSNDADARAFPVTTAS